MNPCQRCIEAVAEGVMERESIQPMRKPMVMNSLAADWKGPNGEEYHCADCEAASCMARVHGFTWGQARLAIGERRREMHRLPQLPRTGPFVLMRANAFDNMEELYSWLDEMVPGEWG